MFRSISALVAGVLALALVMQDARPPAGGAPPADKTATAQETLAIVGVSVVDVAAGRLRADQTVVVRSGRITSVGAASVARIPSNARVLDGRGRYLMPGLWDMHVHTAGAQGPLMLPVHLAFGVTGVRDMGADLRALRLARARITAGRDIGPRIIMAGPILDGPLGWPMPVAHRRWRIEVTDAARAAQLVDSLSAGGADFIKVHERLAADVYRAIVRQARIRGLRIAGHVPTAVGAAAVADAGQLSVEHLVNVPFACTAAERETLRAQSAIERLFSACAGADAPDFTARWLARGTWHTPTLVVQRRFIFGLGATAGDPALSFVPASIRAMLRQVMPIDAPPPPAAVQARLLRLHQKRLAQVAALHRAGVGLLVGSDAPGVAPGWSVHEELRLLVVAGLSPADALRAATLNPARYLGATDSLGTVAVGRSADLVLLRANPLADIRHTQTIVAVVAAGRLYERAAIDRILLAAARSGQDAPAH